MAQWGGLDAQLSVTRRAERCPDVAGTKRRNACQPVTAAGREIHRTNQRVAIARGIRPDSRGDGRPGRARLRAGALVSPRSSGPAVVPGLVSPAATTSYPRWYRAGRRCSVNSAEITALAARNNRPWCNRPGADSFPGDNPSSIPSRPESIELALPLDTKLPDGPDLFALLSSPEPCARAKAAGAF